MIKGYENVILTPNVNEYSRLCKSVLGNYNATAQNQLSELAQAYDHLAFAFTVSLGSVTIVKKGETDIISNGKQGKASQKLLTFRGHVF